MGISDTENKKLAVRKKRLAEALRANLQRRKSQARGRKADEQDADSGEEQKQD